ncbi:MAG: sensor diguanylate cyclase [Herminiimonas sp.]|nr:sensor diguanylate cyclase [Herminiimonas sp.]
MTALRTEPRALNVAPDMTNPDRLNRTDSSLLIAEPTGVFSDEMDQQIARIRRLGRRLFGVADCVVTLGAAARDCAGEADSTASVETAFCRGLPVPDGLVVVPDARIDPSLRRHLSVAGAPYIRFYAAHPVRSSDNIAVGSVSLVDCVPRTFSSEDRQLLADLTALVERELHLKSVSASELDLQKKNRNLQRKSLIDPLIDTWNRGAIMRILTIEAERCGKIGVPLSLIVVDLDYFKKINDTYGHPAGDSVLVRVAGRLRSCIRSQEALGRYGGEEFLIVLPGSPQSTAMAVAERLRQAIASQPEAIGDTLFNLTISAGVASTELFPSATTEELISRADVALYAAKDAGRNCVVQALPD